MTPEAAAYLSAVLDLMQRRSVRRARVDWDAVRREAMALVPQAATPAETYPAIRLAISLVGERHTFFVEADQVRRRRTGVREGTGLMTVYPPGVAVLVFPHSPAARAGIREGDIIETVDGVPREILGEEGWHKALGAHTPVRLTLRRRGHREAVPATLQRGPFDSYLSPLGRRLAGDVGYLELPEHVGRGADDAANEAQGERYASEAHQLMREVDEPAVRGWIVDLRRNQGGNLWPMLAALGPLLGEAPWRPFVGPDGAADQVGNTVTYRDGQVWDRLHPHGAQGPAEDHLRAKAAEPYRLKEPDPPVAVLTSHFTGSSAEFVALAFRGRPRTRSFGGPTAGGTSGNEPQVLPDGAMLYLTVCLGADREGETYDGPILPDEAVAQDWAELGTARDGVLQAALAWLGRQPRGG